MKLQYRPNRLEMYGQSKTYIMYQPKGVVGNIVPWNFPIDISIGPLVDILAAGNRAIIKPSELAPASARLIKEMVEESFDKDLVAVVTGGTDLAQAFAGLPWDHLLYTGGPVVGKKVMKAASENLTPVTLELGGKNPTIIAPDDVNKKTVNNILASKIIKNGQMCISVDYVFVPEAYVDRFVSLAKSAMSEMIPSYTTNSDSTGIINESHLNRLISYLHDAREKGGKIIELGGGDGSVNYNDRKLPFSIVLNVSEDMEIMKNEIFGPILPVKTYRSFEDVITYINAHERPLALYLYTNDKRLVDDIMVKTISGGVGINAVAVHATVPSIPFGGIGNSGMGRHHGLEGFLTFSHRRSVFKAGRGYLPFFTYPPYGKMLDLILKWIMLR